MGLYLFLFAAWVFSLYMAFLAGRAHKQRHVDKALLKARIRRDEIEQGNADISDAELDARMRKPDK